MNNDGIEQVHEKITDYHFVKKWGSYGTGDGQFDTPEDISVDSSTGNVYVLDVVDIIHYNNIRIQVFAPN